MDFVKQLWSNSRWVRVLVVIAAVGIVLAVATRGGRPDGAPPAVQPSRPGVLDKLPLPGGNSLPGKAQTTAGKAADVAGKVVDTTGKVVDTTGKVVDRVGQWVEGK